MMLMPGKVVESADRQQKVRVLVTWIAGFEHYDGPEVSHQLESGMLLMLNREPHNLYDKRAVEVYSGDAKLGYVPRRENKTIARLMDEGYDLMAEITETDWSSFPKGDVKIEVYYLKDLSG